MHSTYNEGKSGIFERFIRILKNKLQKYTTLVAKNVCINNLADIVNKYNITYNSAIKMKPDDVKPSPYIDFSKQK